MSCGNSTCKCGSNCACGSSCKCRSLDESSLMMKEAATDMSLGSFVSASSGSAEDNYTLAREDNGCKCGANCNCDTCSCHK